LITERVFVDNGLVTFDVEWSLIDHGDSNFDPTVLMGISPVPYKAMLGI
jgi:hypothetical protein